MPASPVALLAGLPLTHFIPIRSCEPSAAAPGSLAGIAWANEEGGTGCSPILTGSSASPARPRRVSSARASRRAGRASPPRRPRRSGSAGAAARSWPECRTAARAPASPLRYPWAREHRPEPREPPAGAGRRCPLRRPRRDREGPTPRGCLPPYRGQRAPPRRHLGEAPWGARRNRAAARPAPASGCGSSSWPPVSSAPGPSRTWSRRSRATRARSTTPRTRTPRLSRSPPTSASTRRSGSASTASNRRRHDDDRSR